MHIFAEVYRVGYVEEYFSLCDVGFRYFIIVLFYCVRNMDKNTEELVRELELMKEVVTKNPCGEDRKMFGWLAKGIWRLVKPHMRLSMEQVARYMRVDPRTIRRWQKERGFPQGHRTGHHEVSFFADEIVAWEKKMRLATEGAKPCC